MTTTTRKHGARKAVYPLLEQIASVAPDEWWRGYLRDCARGGLPRGVTLNGSVISHTHMGEAAHYELSTNPAQAFNELRGFFTLHLKVQPTTESTKTSSDESRRKTSPDGTAQSPGIARAPTRPSKRAGGGWTAIRSKNVRAALLSRYVEAIKREHSLDSDQCKALRNVLYLADLYELLDDAVQLEDGAIVAVSCVSFDGERFELLRPPGERKKRIVRVPPPPCRSYRGYPAKQLDPDALIEAHMKALRKQCASSIVRKASGIAAAEMTEVDAPSVAG